MKYRKVFINIAFTCMIFLVIAPNVLAATYSCGLSVGDEFVLETIQADKDHYGSSYDDIMNQKRKYRIKSVAHDSANEEYDIGLESWWVINKSEEFGSEPNASYTTSVPEDPTKWFWGRIIVLVPVVPYLLAYNESLSGHNTTVKGSTFTYYYPAPFFNTTGYSYTYDTSSGFIVNTKTFGLSGKILYEMGIASATIPGYDIPLFLGFAISAIICIAYITKRKMVRVKRKCDKI